MAYVGIISGRIGAVITPPRIRVKATKVSAVAEAIVVEPTIVIAVEPASVKSTAMKFAAVEPIPALEPAPALGSAATAMRSSKSEIWLAERGSAQQSSCKDFRRPTYPEPWCMLT